MDILFDIAVYFLDIPGLLILYPFKEKDEKIKVFCEKNFVKARIIGVVFWFLIGAIIAYL